MAIKSNLCICKYILNPTYLLVFETLLNEPIHLCPNGNFQKKTKKKQNDLRRKHFVKEFSIKTKPRL